LNELNNLDFYQQTHPKSLGFEFVKETVILIIESFEIDITDKMRTFTEHIALQIAIALPRKKGTLFITEELTTIFLSSEYNFIYLR
jgi:anhydro-N-acetylmuramic acid kinase